MGKFSGVGTVKKAVTIKVRGDQHFKAEQSSVSDEINTLASNSFHGKVKTANSGNTENVILADEVEVKENDRETVQEILQEDVEGIKQVVEQAEENSKLRSKLKETEIELGKMTARFEKTSENLSKFSLIVDKLLEALPEKDIEYFMQTDDAEFYRNIVTKANKTI